MRALKTIDNQLRIADRRVRFLSRLNPKNARSEFKKLLAACRRKEEYSPVLKYKPIQTNLAALTQGVKELAIDIPPVKNERWFFARQLEKKRMRILAKIRALQSRGTPEFIKYSEQLFGLPQVDQVVYARRILKNSGGAFQKIEDIVSAKEAAEALQKYLDEKELQWRVKIRESISSKAGLDARSRYLLVKSGESFAPEEVLSLAVHEIETHIYRRENGMRQNFPGLFTEGFAGPPTTEEGLALFNELEHNYDPRRLVIVCARTLAVCLAKNKSFFYVFEKLKSYGISTPYAWAITLRVKRGLADTSRPGAFSKDHHYLKGYLRVKHFFKTGGKTKSLYVGKINIDNAKALRHFKIHVAEPRHLPSYDNRPYFP